jgi:hypothetical protein
VLFTTESGFRRIATDTLKAEPTPFLSLPNDDAHIIGIDRQRNRIAVHNRAGYIAVIDVESGRPLFQRTIEPNSTTELACFDPRNGDLMFRHRSRGLVYRYPIPSTSDLTVDQLLDRVQNHTGLNVLPGLALEEVALKSTMSRADDDALFLDSDLPLAFVCYSRTRVFGARKYADRYLATNPNDWLALLIRGNAARILGDAASFRDDVRQALAIAKQRNEVGQLLPWLQDMAFHVFSNRAKLSVQDRIDIAFEYIDVIRKLPDSDLTLAILLENSHALAAVNEYSEAVHAIETKADELGLKDIQFWE